jgi:RNA polymerase sigma-70 factor (ECF subfamily)
MKNATKSLWALHGVAETVDWEAVYRSDLPRLYDYFLYKTGDRESAQDLTAESFERAWKLRSKYKSSMASVSTWLFGIARNVLKEHFRAGRVSRLDVEARVEDLHVDGDLEEEIQGQQEREMLRRLLLALGERERELVALKYGGRLTNREIAKLTGFSESNVGSILHRVVAGLRRKWQEYHG